MYLSVNVYWTMRNSKLIGKNKITHEKTINDNYCSFSKSRRSFE